jgi:hypothetical protein
MPNVRRDPDKRVRLRCGQVLALENLPIRWDVVGERAQAN